MRYRIEADICGYSDEVTIYTDDESDAKILFTHLLDTKVRPVRLFDGDTLLKKAERGVRVSC